jgi:hypothetical protein
MHYFYYFCDFNFSHKTKYVKQSNWRQDDWACSQMGWPHQPDLGLGRGTCHIFPRPKRRQIWCEYFSIIEALIIQWHKLTLCVRTDNVMDMDNVFIAWDHNDISVKYLPHVFKKIYVLNVSNFPKDLLYKDIPTKFHVYDTHEYFDRIWHLLIFSWIHEKSNKCFYQYKQY